MSNGIIKKIHKSAPSLLLHCRLEGHEDGTQVILDPVRAGTLTVVNSRSK